MGVLQGCCGNREKTESVIFSSPMKERKDSIKMKSPDKFYGQEDLSLVPFKQIRNSQENI